MVMLLVVGEAKGNLTEAREKSRRVKPAEQLQFNALFNRIGQ